MVEVRGNRPQLAELRQRGCRIFQAMAGEHGDDGERGEIVSRPG
jgi:hypothetical protein